MYPYTNIWDHCEEMALRNGLTLLESRKRVGHSISLRYCAPRIDKASYDRWAGYR